MSVPGSAPVARRRSGTPGGASIDDTFLANMIFDTPTKSSTPSGGGSSLQKSPHHKSTSALNDVMSPLSHASNDVESSSFLADLTSGYADEFDMSPTSSIVSGHSSMFSKAPPNRSNQGPRDFDLADDILQHFSIKDPRSSGPSPMKGIEIPATSSPVTRYKRASSPALMERPQYRSASPLQEMAHSYHPPSHLHRPPHTHQTGPGRQAPQQQKLLYDNEAAIKNNPRKGPPTGGGGSKIPVPVGSRPANSSESYDLHEMLQVWEKSNKNPFGEGTLV